jgi:hypothetical protein
VEKVVTCKNKQMKEINKPKKGKGKVDKEM